MAATGIRPGDGILRAAVRLLTTASVAAAVAVSGAGCDYFAEKKLVVGQHTEQDVRQLMGASTPHFALQLRNRIRTLIRGLPPEDPARLLGEQEIARLERLGFEGELRGEPAQDTLRGVS